MYIKNTLQTTSLHLSLIRRRKIYETAYQKPSYIYIDI